MPKKPPPFPKFLECSGDGEPSDAICASLIHALPIEERRVFSCREAASYVGVSPGKFEQLVRDGGMPAPLPYGRVRRWDKVGLDRALDKLGGFSGTPEQEPSPYDEWRQMDG